MRLSQLSFLDIQDCTKNLDASGHKNHGVASNNDLKLGKPLVPDLLQNPETENSQSQHFIDDESFKKYKQFKHFDVVHDFSDHHYSCSASQVFIQLIIIYVIECTEDHFNIH